MVPRRRRNRPSWVQPLPAQPLLTIMLGLISVMAVASMGLSLQRREAEKTNALVTLADIPPNYKPLHIRCGPDTIQWRDDRGAWQNLSLGRGGGLQLRNPLSEARRFSAFLEAKAEANRRLSFSDQQHTVILWIEPEGVLTALELEQLLSTLGLPLRVGQLPILANEKIVDGMPP